jgi:hypothetical protein
MKSSWTQGLDEQAIKDVKGDFLSSLVTRKRLAVLLNKKIEEAETTALNKEGYDVSNWALKQADLIGYKRALSDVIKLILD